MKRTLVPLLSFAVGLVIAQPVPSNWQWTRWNCRVGTGHYAYFGGIVRSNSGYVFTGGDLDFDDGWSQSPAGACYDPSQVSLERVWQQHWLNSGDDYARGVTHSQLRQAFYLGGTFYGNAGDAGVVRFLEADGSRYLGRHYLSGGQSCQSVCSRDFPALAMARVWAVGVNQVTGQGSNFAVFAYVDSGSGPLARASVQYSGPGAQRDSAIAAGCDGETLFVTGVTRLSSGYDNFWTMAFSNDLATCYWQHVWPNVPLPHSPCDILVGPDGYIYVCGTGQQASGDNDFVAVKYRRDGTVAGYRYFNINESQSANCRDADILWDGVSPADYSVWLTGHAPSNRIATARLTPGMDSSWASAFRPNDSYAEGTQVRCDGTAGRVVVGGRISSGGFYFSLLEYTDGSPPAVTGYGDFLLTDLATNEKDNVGLVLAGPDVAYLAGIDGTGTRDLYIVEFGRTYVHDVGVIALLAPADTVLLGQAVTPRCRVRNFGTSTESFSVRCAIEGESHRTATVSGLAPGQEQTVSFASWTPSEPGRFAVRCSTMLATDQRRWNDAESGSVFVLFRDVGAVEILEPAGQYDPGAVVEPRATWANHGNVPADFQAWMLLDDPSGTRVYSELLAVAGLEPGAETTLTAFPQFPLDSAGPWTARCSTWQAGDVVDTNDVIETGFSVGSADVGVTRLLAPRGTLDTGATVVPTAGVRNHGDVTTGFRAWFALGAPGDVEVYRESLDVEPLAAGAEDTLFFPQFAVGARAGDWATRCSVFVAGDELFANDTLGSGFRVIARTSWPPGWEEVESMPSSPSGRAVKDGGWLAIGNTGIIYAAKGNKAPDFYGYEPRTGTWTTLAPFPPGTEGKPPRKGSRGAHDGAGLVYATKGNNTLGFWRYEPATDNWQQLPDVPLGGLRKKVKGGTDLVHVTKDDTAWVYLLKGYRDEFYRFNVPAGRWDTMPRAPAGQKPKWDKGSWLVHDGERTIYAHKARYYDRARLEHELWRYDLPGDSWRQARPRGMPLVGLHSGRLRKKKAKDGGCGAWSDNEIHALKGGNTQQFFKYLALADSWVELDTMPTFGTTNRKKRVKSGGDIVAYGGGAFFALKGNKTRELWRYVVHDQAALPGRERVRAGAQALAGEPRAAGLVIGPNPLAGGLVTLRAPAGCGPARVRVFDAAGRCVLTRELVSRNPAAATVLDCRGLANGAYLVRVEGDRALVGRLVISR